MLIRDLLAEEADLGLPSPPLRRLESKNEVANAIVSTFARSLLALDGADEDELPSLLADMKELLDVLDQLLERKISVAQVNKRKLYGSYEKMYYQD